MASISSSTSTGSSSSMNILSAKTGIGGLVSGMDIDELVYNLTASSRQKILKQQQMCSETGVEADLRTVLLPQR